MPTPPMMIQMKAARRSTMTLLRASGLMEASCPLRPRKRSRRWSTKDSTLLTLTSCFTAKSISSSKHLQRKALKKRIETCSTNYMIREWSLSQRESQNSRSARGWCLTRLKLSSPREWKGGKECTLRREVKSLWTSSVRCSSTNSWQVPLQSHHQIK